MRHQAAPALAVHVRLLATLIMDAAATAFYRSPHGVVFDQDGNGYPKPEYPTGFTR